MEQYFEVPQAVLSHLAACDNAFGNVIQSLPVPRRRVTPDLFAALAENILAQQISTKAYETVRTRLLGILGNLTPESVLQAGETALRSAGISGRKAFYLQSAAIAFANGTLQPQALAALSDEAFCKAVCALPGVGPWTAQMLLLFCLQRPDVFAASDFGVCKGLRMVYGQAVLSPQFLAERRVRFSPYASVACLYLWEVSGGALPHLVDPANTLQKNKV